MNGKPMTVGEFKSAMAKLPDYLDNMVLEFCHNPSADVCDNFVITENGCLSGKTNVIIHIDKVSE